jgi:hypothetical protein
LFSRINSLNFLYFYVIETNAKKKEALIVFVQSYMIHCLHFQNGRTCLGDFIYRYITSDQFSQECLLDCIDISNDHVALEIANRLEAAIYVWRRRSHSRPPLYPIRSTTKSSWEIVKDFMVDGDKRDLLAERAESILISLKQRFPGLSQTTLDTSKIQYNKVPCFSFFFNALHS